VSRRRSLVQHTQTVGGRTTLSLAFDGAGKASPAEVVTGKRCIPRPVDQVVITATDSDKVAQFERGKSQRTVVRRVAPPGGVSSLKIE
jgi:hypothetical protein